MTLTHTWKHRCPHMEVNLLLLFSASPQCLQLFYIFLETNQNCTQGTQRCFLTHCVHTGSPQSLLLCFERTVYNSCAKGHGRCRHPQEASQDLSLGLVQGPQELLQHPVLSQHVSCSTAVIDLLLCIVGDFPTYFLFQVF